jgi:hypothetical protein
MESPGDIPTAPGRAGPRILSIVLGAWLTFSAFLWPHTTAQRVNSWAVGILAVVAGLVALAVPAARYVGTALAVWIFVTAWLWVIPGQSPGTVWNNAFVGIAMFLASLTATDAEATRYHGGRHA